MVNDDYDDEDGNLTVLLLSDKTNRREFGSDFWRQKKIM